MPGRRPASRVRALAVGLDNKADRVTAAARQITTSLTGMQHGGGGSGAAAGNGNTQVGPVHVSVSGFIGSERELATELSDLIQAEALKHNRRNSSNGLNRSSGRFG